ncbi:MAG: FmdB family zinc ribbon protein [Gammaproteobacteria bacterium]
MPIYEYACKQCGHTFDALQKMSEEPLRICPECEAPELRKLVSAPNFRLKGGGWYETDFKTDNKRNLVDGAAKSDSKDAKSGNGGEKSKDAKSDKGGKADKPDKPKTAGSGTKSADKGG